MGLKWSKNIVYIGYRSIKNKCVMSFSLSTLKYDILVCMREASCFDCFNFIWYSMHETRVDVRCVLHWTNSAHRALRILSAHLQTSDP